MHARIGTLSVLFLISLERRSRCTFGVTVACAFCCGKVQGNADAHAGNDEALIYWSGKVGNAFVVLHVSWLSGLFWAHCSALFTYVGARCIDVGRGVRLEFVWRFRL